MTQSINLPPLTPELEQSLATLNQVRNIFDKNTHLTLLSASNVGYWLNAIRNQIIAQYEPATRAKPDTESREGQMAWVAFAEKHISLSLTQIKRYITLYRYYDVHKAFPLGSNAAIGTSVLAISARPEVLKELNERLANGEKIKRSDIEHRIRLSRTSKRITNSVRVVVTDTLKVIQKEVPNDMPKETWLALRDELTDAADNITAIIKTL